MKRRSRGRPPGDVEADRRTRGWNDLPLPLVVLLAAVLVGFVISLGGLLEPPTATSPVAQADPTARVNVPSARPAPPPAPTPAPSAMPAATALPDGYHVLAADVENASFGLRPERARPETALRLTAGTALIFESERIRGRCRVRLLDGDEEAGNEPQVWLDCVALAVQP